MLTEPDLALRLVGLQSFSVSLAAWVVSLFLFFFYSAAVAALLVTSNAGVVEAACWAVANLAYGNAENQAKLGAAGVYEGGYRT